jgi:putative addiction module killer protein
VEVTPQQVFMLVLEDGSCPAEEWLTEEIRDDVTRARISRRIDKLQRGSFGDWKSTQGAVQELRLDFGPGYRVYYARRDRASVIVIAGGGKRTQRTDIRRAGEWWSRFIQTGSPDKRLRIWDPEEEDGGDDG